MSFKKIHTTEGKLTVLSVISGLFVLLFIVSFNFSTSPTSVTASNLDTSVTVLNTPPLWTVDAEEQTESSAINPTNSSSTVSFIATATDSNAESYYLIICKTSGAPTANAGAAPTCGGGSGNQWAVSAFTISAIEATATYTAQAADAESNDWYAWICDANVTLPRCNTTFKQGTGTTLSPFIVNHRPVFTSFTDDSPANPGVLVTWTTIASDPDIVGGADTVKLFVCKSNDFAAGACGAGGTYGTSTLSASNPVATFTLENPKQDKIYTAHGYIVDNHGHTAIGATQGSDSALTVSNVLPVVTPALISLLDTDEVGGLTLTSELAETAGFKVKFTVSDNNSCLNSTGGDEIASSIANVYRSGVTSASCQLAGDYNPNSCYTGAQPSAVWNLSCTQDVGSCTGATDSDATWTCTFPLWHLADPTDGSSLVDSTWFAENWKTSVRATDDNTATSTLIEGTTGNELISFLAYSVGTTSISYGGLEPGQLNDPIDKITAINATGNVGLDQTLYGEPMCTTFSGPGSCGVSATSTIPVDEQKYATSSIAYASALSLIASPGAAVDINVKKSTSTSTPETKDTYWGIQVPGTITLAGSYIGQNTIIGVKGEATNW